MTTTLYYVGLDVAVKKTQICIVDQDFKILHEAKVETDPETIALYLYERYPEFHRVGLESGLMTQWLYTELAKAGLPVICIEAKHANAFIQSQVNKNDRNDARGIARMMQANIFKPVHVKSIESQRQRALLSARKVIQSKMIDIELTIRGLTKNFGIKLGVTSRANFDRVVMEAIANDQHLIDAIQPLLICRRALREQMVVLHKKIVDITKDDDVTGRLMTCPGVGPLTALTFKSAIDIPQRFSSSKAVGAHVGLTPKQYQSGEVEKMGRISKCGDRDVRSHLVEAAMCLLFNVKKSCALKTWGQKLAKRRGTQKAAVAVARRLAIILHRMWVDKTDFRWENEPVGVAA